jgi:hypothetical protein
MVWNRHYDSDGGRARLVDCVRNALIKKIRLRAEDYLILFEGFRTLKLLIKEGGDSDD